MCLPQLRILVHCWLHWPSLHSHRPTLCLLVRPLAVTCGWNYEDPTAQQPSRGQVLRKPSFPPLLSTTSMSCVSVLFVWASGLKTGLCVNIQEMLEGSGHVTHTCCDFLGVGGHAACGVWGKKLSESQSPAYGVWTAPQRTRLAQLWQLPET